jgi:hypothetical protein
MKPRLEPAEPTRMDCVTWAWVEWGESQGRGAIIGDISLESDRRDADLMLRLTKLVGMRPGLHIFWATNGLEYPDIEAIVTEWIG